jgi:hypothetical protein
VIASEQYEETQFDDDEDEDNFVTFMMVKIYFFYRSAHNCDLFILINI